MPTDFEYLSRETPDAIMLLSSGGRIAHWSNGAESGYAPRNALDRPLESLHREAPDLIICDEHLPRLDDYAMIAALRHGPASRAIPALAVTVPVTVDDREKFLDAGLDGCVSKPIAPDTFVAEITCFLPAPHKKTHAAEPGLRRQATRSRLNPAAVFAPQQNRRNNGDHFDR